MTRPCYSWPQAFLEADNPALSVFERLTLLVLAGHMNELGEMTPTPIATLAAECALPVPTVTANLARLVELGWLDDLGDEQYEARFPDWHGGLGT